MSTSTLPIAAAAGITAALIYRRHLNRPNQRPKVHPRWEGKQMPTAAELLAELHAHEEETR